MEQVGVMTAHQKLLSLLEYSLDTYSNGVTECVLIMYNIILSNNNLHEWGEGSVVL